MQHRFLRKRGAAGGDTPSVIAYGDATFPKGTASAVVVKFSAQLKGVPLGELSSVARLRGNLASLRTLRCPILRERICETPPITKGKFSKNA